VSETPSVIAERLEENELQVCFVYAAYLICLRYFVSYCNYTLFYIGVYGDTVMISMCVS